MKRVAPWFTRPPSMAMAALLLILLHPSARGPEPASPLPICAPDRSSLAIAAVGESPGSEIARHAGRAPFFVLVDRDSGRIETVANEHAAAVRSAGTKTAHRLAEMGVDCLVAGEVGPRMRAVLTSEGIAFVAARGPVGLTTARVSLVHAGRFRGEPPASPADARGKP